MVKDLVANSPFINIEFIKSSEKINEPDSKVLFDYYKLDSNTISFQINRDFSDYRITPYFSDDQIGDLKIKNFELDSLSYFQIKQFLNQNTFTSIEIIKSDISVYLELPNSYESYLNELSKKNRHELKRKNGYSKKDLEKQYLKKVKIVRFSINSLVCIKNLWVRKAST